MKPSSESSIDNKLSLFIVYGFVAIIAVCVSLFVQYQATPFWSCEYVYGYGFYAVSCFNMAFPMFVYIIGIVMFFGIFLCKIYEENIIRFFN